MPKIVLDLDCDPDGLFCGECLFIKEPTYECKHPICKIFNEYLKPKYDYYERTEGYYRNEFCLKAEENFKRR